MKNLKLFFWVAIGALMVQCSTSGGNSASDKLNDKDTVAPKAQATSPLTPKQQDQIAQIRVWFSEINSNITAYKEVPVHSPSEHYSCTGYFEGNALRKIRLDFTDANGTFSKKYYYMNGELFFIFSTEKQYNAPIIYESDQEAQEAGFEEAYDEEKTKLSEHRYYFSGEKLIRWLDTRKNKISPKDKRFKAKQNELLKKAAELRAQVEAAR